ncbi:hypothetical protein ACFOHS_12980 [Jhaorihella thermophila]|uniref:Uncharacterized protein n=2 Tax=Jhaorihella thermophila TaxID=488547 RepID=A0A1H5YEN0_9RHOB|nr:hypothetical protein SAMN05421751_11727 [Jhaorihella thermophila]
MLGSLAALFVRLVVMVALIVGPVAPGHAMTVQAGQNPAGPAWIEIRADGGAVLVRAEDDLQAFDTAPSDDPSHDDCDCAACLCGILQAGIAALPAPAGSGVPQRTEM